MIDGRAACGRVPAALLNPSWSSNAGRPLAPVADLINGDGTGVCYSPAWLPLPCADWQEGDDGAIYRRESQQGLGQSVDNVLCRGRKTAR